MKLLVLLLGVVLLVGGVCAITTEPIGIVTSNSVVLNAAGAASPWWFEYGQLSGSLSWKTPNTSTSGAVTKTIKGSPLNGNTVFFVRACDTSGCGAELSFTTLSITPMPTSTYRYIFDNITESGFDPQFIAQNAIEPYMWTFNAPMFRLLVFGLLFFALFTGLVLTGRGMGIAVVLGLLSASFFMIPGAGLFMGIPPEFSNVGMGVMYAAMAGLIVYLFKK